MSEEKPGASAPKGARPGGGEADPGGSEAEPGETEAEPGGTEAAPAGSDAIRVRLVMPDRWLEHVAELPGSMTVEEAKRLGLREMLLRDTDDPDDFYTEYAERRVPDESLSLAELGLQPNEMLSIRAYDLGHYPRFRG